MNANSSISSTGRPNSRRREVFIFSPLNFAHWGGEVYDETTAADETEKLRKSKKNFKSKLPITNHGTKYCYNSPKVNTRMR